MQFIKMALWTAFFIGVGIFLASYPVEGGKTALQHAEHAWKTRGASELTQLRDRFSNAVVGKPRERHSDEDREALNRLIARRGTSARD